MAKYDPLNGHLQSLETEQVHLDFGEIEEMVGGLPNSAFEDRAWWANSLSHPNAVAWLDAGWEVTGVDFRYHRVTLRRRRAPALGTKEPIGGGRRSDRPSRGIGKAQRVEALINGFSDLLDYCVAPANG